MFKRLSLGVEQYQKHKSGAASRVEDWGIATTATSTGLGFGA